MGNPTWKDKIKEQISHMCWLGFLWANNMSEEQYHKERDRDAYRQLDVTKAWAIFDKEGLVFAEKEQPNSQVYVGSGRTIMADKAEVLPVSIFKGFIWE